MNLDGLIDVPDFNDIEKYLSSGDRTLISEKIKQVASLISR